MQRSTPKGNVEDPVLDLSPSKCEQQEHVFFLLSQTMPRASLRLGTWLTRLQPWSYMEGTLFLVPVQQVEPPCPGQMPMSSAVKESKFEL